jgi:hypothetical protein
VSRIYFHSPSGEAQVAGTERAWMGCLIDDIGMATVNGNMLKNLDEWCEVWLYGKRFSDLLISSGNPGGLPYSTLVERASIALRRESWGPDQSGIWYRGHRIKTENLTANTAMLVGSEHVQLAVRLHNQCEIHSWVDGPNRAWLPTSSTPVSVEDVRNTVGRDGGWGCRRTAPGSR